MKIISLSLMILGLLVLASSIQVISGFDYQKQDIPLQENTPPSQNQMSTPQLQKEAQLTTVTKGNIQDSSSSMNSSVSLPQEEAVEGSQIQDEDDSMNTTQKEDNLQNGTIEMNNKKDIPKNSDPIEISSLYSNSIDPVIEPEKSSQKNYEEAVMLLHENPEEQNLEIASIVVTTFNGGSYDELFRVVKQRSTQGSRTLVYEVKPYLIDIFESKMRQAVYDASYQGRSVLDLMINRILGLSQKCPKCIVFNWECSSGYSQRKFPEGNEKVLKFAQFVIQRGHIAMFSDFSLKALIRQWNSQFLGPNPFEQVGGTSVPVDLIFDRQVLFNSPSTQLHAVAQLAENESVKVQVLGGTIVYKVRQDRQNTEKYELQILTQAVGSNRDIFPAAGHVLLKYASGGYLLTSMVHWIELSKIDTSAQRFFNAASKLYGDEPSYILQQTYQSLPQNEKASFISSNSALLVQDQSPAYNILSLSTAN